jgi:large subunit ribosomal protein L3
MKHVLGFKKGMTQVFDEGKTIPATVVVIPENYVALIEDKKGTCRVGILEKKNPSQAEQGVYKEIKKVPQHVWSVKADKEGIKVGDILTADDFEIGEEVKVTGTTKAKGFAGVVKRWNFKGGPRTHGQSDRLRAPGSIGGGTDPGRVLKGKKMPGRMGGVVRTLRNKKILAKGDGYLVLSGPLPGSEGTLLKIALMNKDED